MTTSPEEPTAQTSTAGAEPPRSKITRPESARTPQPLSHPLPRRQRGPSAIAEAAAVVADRSQGGSSAASDASKSAGDDPETAPRMSAAAAEFAALTAVEPDPAPTIRRASGDAAATNTARDVRSNSRSGTSTTTTPQAAPSAPGRPRKALLAGAALLGVLLIAVPFLITGGDGDRNPTRAGSAGDTVLGDHWTGDGTGTFGTATPSDGSTSPHASGNEATGQAVDPQDTPTPHTNSSNTAPEQQPKPSSSATRNTTPGVRIRGIASGRCVDVTGGSTAERTPLQIWDCSGTGRQSWRFASDGTVRALGMCMDVDGGSRDDGAAIQLVSCNATGAQQFRLNAAHDLVNVQADKCVDVKDVATGNGARLQLWSCNGADNQKWSAA
ncbi:RICIN domain-containing protein [Streptomyces sp. NPDC056704]|uniref:RICIN domain-containing protein n=1 Tax=Streptomyces sp. NPDC056704 TaxID=3345917 RepID=UPI0036AD4EDB